MKSLDAFLDIAVPLTYVAGIPVSFGVLLKLGFGPAALLLAPVWPATALVGLGYWVVS